MPVPRPVLPPVQLPKLFSQHLLVFSPERQLSSQRSAAAPRGGKGEELEGMFLQHVSVSHLTRHPARGFVRSQPVVAGQLHGCTGALPTAQLEAQV